MGWFWKWCVVAGLGVVLSYALKNVINATKPRPIRAKTTKKRESVRTNEKNNIFNDDTINYEEEVEEEEEEVKREVEEEGSEPIETNKREPPSLYSIDWNPLTSEPYNIKPKRTIWIYGDPFVGKQIIYKRILGQNIRVDEGGNLQEDESLPPWSSFIKVSVKIKQESEPKDYYFDLQWWDHVNRDEFQQEFFGQQMESMFRKVAGFMIVYKFEEQESLMNSQYIVDYIKDQKQLGVPIILVGNRSGDYNEEFEYVCRSNAEKVANHWGLQFFEVNAITGEGLHKSFTHILSKTILSLLPDEQ